MKSATDLEIGATTPVRFTPNWGDDDWRLWQLVAAVQANEFPDTVESMLRDIEKSDLPSHHRIAYSLSLVSDLLRAGGSVWIRDSELFFSWPEWRGEDGRRVAREALEGAKESRRLNRAEIERVKHFFAPDLDGESLAVVLTEAEFNLVSVSQIHAPGVTYQEAFSAALHYWSMPYRGRSGRMRRFVLLAKHRLLGEEPVVAGILELGDESPFGKWRDDLLGLSAESFFNWASTLTESELSKIAVRLRNIRSTLRTTSDGRDFSRVSADNIVGQLRQLESEARGRSQVLEKEKDILKDRKRIAYAVRLARGEWALNQILKGQSSLVVDDAHMRAGVRAIHDITVPRVHLEATVCGAIPPFSAALGGKLLVTFLSHPNVVSAVTGAESELLDWSFDTGRLSTMLPNHGALGITTKGLYSDHAAIYNRADMLGVNGLIRLRQLGTTIGTTTSLASERTARLSRKVLSSIASDKSKVSSLYGSGGSKRQRAIEAAASTIGLSPRLALAGIRRPVYGSVFVENSAAVCWLNRDPEWIVPRAISAFEFDRQATAAWRKRWLGRAIERVRDFAVAPSMIRYLNRGANDREPSTEDENTYAKN